MNPQTGSNPSSTPGEFRSKLGTYLLGVGIGFAALGVISSFKSQAIRREQALEQGVGTEPRPVDGSMEEGLATQGQPEGESGSPRGVGEEAGARP